jgi:Pyruvate/2-oxoacid:ferredoxin oxidoreductase delta subunit
LNNTDKRLLLKRKNFQIEITTETMTATTATTPKMIIRHTECGGISNCEMFCPDIWSRPAALGRMTTYALKNKSKSSRAY